MAVTTFEIKTYVIQSGNNVSFKGLLSKCRGAIICQSGSFRIAAYFTPFEDQLATRVISPGVANIFMPQEFMPIWIDMLRNEKPVYGVISTDFPDRSRITTDLEEVGQDEDS